MRIETRTDTTGCIYLGIPVPGGEKVFIAAHEAEALADDITSALVYLHRCDV